MKQYRLTPAAENDLFEIWAHIASDNLTAADDLESEFFRMFQRLADQPDLGHYRRDLTDKPVRFFCVRDVYLVVYNAASDPIVIVRVLHGSRDAVAQLND
jgi:plasmid stabilization system protein ParE